MAEPIYRVIDNGLGELIAVGASGLILHSTDAGTTWNARYSGTTEHLYGAAYGDSLGVTGWIVVGANATILKSTDGITWFPIANTITEDLYDIAFGGIFIAIGTNGFMASSENFGATWFFNESGTTEDLYSITIDFSSYIITGAADTVIVGEVLSLNFNIELIERITATDTKASEFIAEDTVTDSFQVVSATGGRTAGQKVRFTTSGTVEAGDTYTVTLDGVNYDLLTTTEVTHSDIVDGLVSLVNASTKFFAYNDAGTLLVTSDNPPTPFTYTESVTDAGTIDAAISSTLVQGSIVQQISAQIVNAEIGDSFTVTLDGVDFTYVATVADDASTAASLAALVDASPSYEAVTVGDTIFIYGTDPEKGYTYTYSTINGGATDNQDIVLSLLVENTIDGMTYYEFLTDETLMLNPLEEPLGVYNHEIIEVVDTLDTFVANGNFNHEVIDGLVATDTIAFTFANGIGGELSLYPLTVNGTLENGSAIFGDLSLPSLKVVGSLLKELGGDLVLPMMTVEGTLGAVSLIEGNLILPRLQISGQLIVEVGDTEYVVWVINQDTKAHSNYTDFKANSLGKFNGVDIIATEDGIYELQAGEQDEEGPIDARITWVPTDYGVPTLKRLDAAYVNMRHATGGVIRTVADENEERIYECEMAQQASGMHKKRVLLVRGLAAEYWQVGFESTDGRFTIGDIEVTPVASKRRIK